MAGSSFAERLKTVSLKHYAGMGLIYLFFCFASFVTMFVSSLLRYIPWYGYSDEKFKSVATSLADDTMPSLIVANLILLAVVSLWIVVLRSTVVKVTAALDETVAALLGAILGAALIGTIFGNDPAHILDVLKITGIALLLSVIVRTLLAPDFDARPVDPSLDIEPVATKTRVADVAFAKKFTTMLSTGWTRIVLTAAGIFVYAVIMIFMVPN